MNQAMGLQDRAAPALTATGLLNSSASPNRQPARSRPAVQNRRQLHEFGLIRCIYIYIRKEPNHG